MTQDPNVVTVELVAQALGALCEEFVLVGGCTVGLLITDQTRPAIRATIDVDLITEVASMADYYQLQEKLKKQGFVEEGGEVIVRWLKGNLMIDVMPTKEIGLGFSNRWYQQAIETAQVISLSEKTKIKVVTAPLFIATKLESFNDRGGGDYSHHDMEDIVNVVDGRTELIEEVQSANEEVRKFIMQEFDDLLGDPDFTDRLPWLFDQLNQARVPLTIKKMRTLAGL